MPRRLSSLWDQWVPPALEPREPRLQPLFGVQPFTPQTACADVHGDGITAQEIPDGSRCCCAVCSKSGVDWMQALRRDAKDRNGDRRWPRREPSKKYAGKPLLKGKRSRSDKRRKKAS